MDPYNRDGMNVDMTASFGDGRISAPTVLDPRIFEAAAPSAMLPESESAHCMVDQGSCSGDKPPPYTTVPGADENAFPASVINGPYEEPAFDQPQNNPFAGLQPIIAFASEPQQKPTDVETEDWIGLTNFDISDFTQTPITSIPSFQTLYEAYVASYTDATATNATRMKYAQAFAFAMLKHYYPTSQNYTVEPASLGPIAKHGMSFILQADNGSDVWRDLPAKPPVKKAKKKGGLTKKQRELATAVAQTEEYNHGLNYVANLHWDWIEPQDIAGFVVHRKVKVTDKENRAITYETRPYTYLAIMIDTFDEPPRFSTANIMHRSDVLADVLCRNAQLADGHGFLFYGPRIEFYAFRPGREWLDNENDEQIGNLKGGEAGNEQRNIEPMLWSLADDDREEDQVVDIRTMGLQAVDLAMRSVVYSEVEWTDGTMMIGYENGVGGSNGFGIEGYGWAEAAGVGGHMVKEET